MDLSIHIDQLEPAQQLLFFRPQELSLLYSLGTRAGMGDLFVFQGTAKTRLLKCSKTQKHSPIYPYVVSTIIYLYHLSIACWRLVMRRAIVG
jgi:hypothetical protein